MHAAAAFDTGMPSSAQFGRCRLQIQAVILIGRTSLLWELFIPTYPSLCWVASVSSWKSCASSKTSTYSNSWWKNKYLYTKKKNKETNAQQEDVVLMCANGREKQEGEGGSRGVTALIECFEPPGWVVRCDITYKHDQTESKKRVRGAASALACQ